jgi:V-type H+-transporting ATPase subunit a
MYGVPAYKEINPALFTIMTFPIQFGIMFGDIGHGFIHLLVALALFCPSVARMSPWIPKTRYMYLFMALMAIFCGSLYNEVFSIPLNLFGSCYTDRQV